jgi:hypothetical protein
MAKRKGRGRRRAPNAVRASRAVRAGASVRAGDSTTDETGSFRSSLARLLDAPHLARLVPHLAPETLHQVIRHSGLDACGELVASATPEQLTSILDLDLWRHPQPGRDEQFDADRFGEWLEVLVDTGEAVAARIVAALDEHLVIAGLSRYIRVFDPSAFAPSASTDDEPIDGSLTRAEGPECEVGGYLVSAIRADAWDAIVTVLVALEAAHRDSFHAVMSGCRRLSNSIPEADGLDDLLIESEQLLHDVAADREHRRSQQGYSTPADARAFLQMARHPRRPRPPSMKVNPIAAAYFRAADDTGASLELDTSRLPGRALEPLSTDGSVSETLDAIARVLAEAGLVPDRPLALLAGTAPQPSPLTRLRPLMAHVRDTDDHAYLTRSRELAFLANTLMAGCSVQSRPFTPQEASDAAAAICNVGLEHWPARWPDAEMRGGPPTSMPETFLVDHDLVMTFEAGWAVLHEDVSMFVAEQLIATLADLRCVDADVQDGLDALRRELVRQRDAGTPWRARHALEVLAMLDTLSWASLRGLLDECPVLPAALTATLERQIGGVSATAFAFISTTGQIGEVRAFMRRLADALSR